MNIFLSILIWLIFMFFNKIKQDWWLDTISFKLLWLRQLPEVNLSFLWVIIKKLLLFPIYISEQLWWYKIFNSYYKISNINYNQIIIFLFYFLFSYFLLIISKRFYWKDAIIVKLILTIILLTIVYFI